MFMINNAYCVFLQATHNIQTLTHASWVRIKHRVVVWVRVR